MKYTSTSPPNKKGKKLFIYWILLSMLLTLLVTSSYTWFALSRTPRVSNIGVYVNAPAGMTLSAAPSGAEWVHRLDFAELVSETAPLRPVTWSQAEGRFYAAQYGVDGRRTGDWHPLSDEINANREGAYGYYIKATFYATSDTPVAVGLTHPMEVEEGVGGAGTYLIGTPLWDSDSILHSDGGQGAQNAVRVGLRITPLEEGEPQEDAAQFYVYEPNCDTHVDGESGYSPTPSIDGTEALVEDPYLIRQTTTTWTEANPVQHGTVIKDMGQFEDDTYLFTLGVGQVVRIDLYVWLEGQDIDCDNRIGHEAQLLANIQFSADSGGQSGLQPIPGR